MSDCCSEFDCTRKKPYKIRKSNFGEIWYLVDKYTVKGRMIHVTSKHDITAELRSALLDDGWTPPKEGDKKS